MARSWEYINRSQIHECGNLKQGRAVSFLGIFVSNFQFSVFAVYSPYAIEKQDPRAIISPKQYSLNTEDFPILSRKRMVPKMIYIRTLLHFLCTNFCTACVLHDVE